jgi:PD-(D/E)XK endonuclease
MLTPREQGDIGELSALDWLAAQGANVSIPFGHSPDYDLVADLGGRLLRVQVKSATFFRNGRWEVSVATYGGNQSWTGLVKRFDASRCDYLFVLVGDGRRWFIPSEALAG